MPHIEGRLVIELWQKHRRQEMRLGEALALALAAPDTTAEDDGLPVVGVEAEGALAELLARLGARVLHAREQGLLRGPVLLLCPTSVVANWRHEAARFAPTLKVLVHHGIGRLAGEEFAQAAGQHDLVVSTYSLAHRDAATLAAVKWAAVVHHGIPQPRLSRALRRIPAPLRYSRGALPRRGPARALRRLVRPFILRRLKTDPQIISDLPEKQENKVYCYLTKEQATLYEAVVRDMLEKIEAAEGMKRRGLVLATISKLKQVCNHPAHFLVEAGPLAGRSGKLARLTEMLAEVEAEGGARGLHGLHHAADRASGPYQTGRHSSLVQESPRLPDDHGPVLSGGDPARHRGRPGR